MKKKVSRREMIRSAALATAGLGVLGGVSSSITASRETVIAGTPSKGQSMIGVPFTKYSTVRLAMIGTGRRGTSLLRDFLNVPGLTVTALCDVVEGNALSAKRMVEKVGRPAPSINVKGERGFEEVVTRQDVDIVIIATPWEWHVPQSVAAMNAGKHVAVEVPAAYTVEDCWKLVDTSEHTRRHCIMLENCCYDDDELMVLNMIRAGVFGEMVHGEAAYNHDLREALFTRNGGSFWRRRHHTRRDGNLYPTHGLGPVANYMNINRGDRFDHIISMSSGHWGLEEYRKEKLPVGDQRQKEVYACGDYNTSMIKTAKGRTIMLQHNVTSPRPYDRVNLIQGTKGIFRDYPSRIFIEADAKDDHEWESPEKYRSRYQHRLWRGKGEEARRLGGHGGMDYLMCYRLIECMREGLVPDMDVYDAVAWSVPGPLSEISVAKGSTPIKFPDFTRGRWREKRQTMQ